MYPDEGIDMNETCSSSSGGGGDDLIDGASRVAAAAAITEEPYEGMEFESEEAAREYYQGYARRVGFVVRLRTCHREKSGKAIARKMGCNKEGYRDVDRRNPTPKNPRPITRGGCKAMIYVKFISSSGKWIVSRFVKEHNHPLVVIPPPLSDSSEDKDRKIQRLTSELQKEERLCAAYREQLTSFLKIIEEQNDHISIKVQSVVDNLKQYECRDEDRQSSNPS